MDHKWKAYGACVGADTSIFYPSTGRNAWQAKELCDICKVKRACLEYALERPERHGVWGGMSERARGRLRAARKKEQNEH